MSPLAPPPKIKPLERLDRRTVSRHRVFDVEEGTWARADGRTLGPLFTLSCPDWANIVAVTDEHELVLVWQYRLGTDLLSLEVPGGVMDPGETPEHAAARELREETGYAARSFERLSAMHPNPALQPNTIHTFVARGAHLAGPVAFDEGEECELALVPLSRARELLRHPSFTHALSIAGVQALILAEGL